MPQRNDLPEGTDHIINGAMETGAGTGASTGSSGSGTTGGLGGAGAGGGFVAGGAAGGLASGTSGTTSGGSTGGLAGGTTGSSSTGGLGGSTSGGSSGQSRGGSSGGGQSPSGSSGGAADKIAGQVREQVSNLRGQATDKARQFADTGKERVTSTLDNLTQVVNEAARSVDERLGAEYGQYAHKAADAVSSFTEGLRGKSVDDLLDDSRSFIRKSPGAAIGAAAVLGFALVRVIKAGLPENDNRGGNDVEFTPDARLSSTNSGWDASLDTTSTSGTSGTVGSTTTTTTTRTDASIGTTRTTGGSTTGGSSGL